MKWKAARRYTESWAGSLQSQLWNELDSQGIVISYMESDLSYLVGYFFNTNPSLTQFLLPSLENSGDVLSAHHFSSQTSVILEDHVHVPAANGRECWALQSRNDFQDLIPHFPRLLGGLEGVAMDFTKDSGAVGIVQKLGSDVSSWGWIYQCFSFLKLGTLMQYLIAPILRGFLIYSLKQNPNRQSFISSKSRLICCVWKPSILSQVESGDFSARTLCHYLLLFNLEL